MILTLAVLHHLFPLLFPLRFFSGAGLALWIGSGDQGCTVSDASLVTIGIGRCCESFALI